jgi:F-type H+-transporting ATPase subunit b
MAMLAQLALIAAENGDTGSQLVQWKPGLWIWTIGIFLLLLIVLYRFGYGTMLSKLDARDQAIRGAIEEARREREEANKLLEEQKQQLDETRRKTAEMISEAQQDAKRERDRILEEARREADQKLQDGRRQIEDETRRALSDIQDAVADLSLQVAERLLQRSVSDEDHKALVERAISQLEQRRGGGPQVSS